MNGSTATSSRLARSLIGSLLLAALGALGAAGCTSSEVSLCNAICDCKGCSDAQRQSCENGFISDAHDAANAGCPQLYDQLVTCSNATETCVGTDFRTSCAQENDRLDRCIEPYHAHH